MYRADCLGLLCGCSAQRTWSASEKGYCEASGNIIKNVKSVIVPNTDGARGIEAAAAIGIVAGHEDLALEVLSKVTEEQKEKFRQYLTDTDFQVRQAQEDRP